MDLNVLTTIVILVCWVIPLVAACAYIFRDTIAEPWSYLIACTDSLKIACYRLICAFGGRQERLQLEIELHDLGKQLRTCRRKLLVTKSKEEKLEAKFRLLESNLEDSKASIPGEKAAKRRLEEASRLVEKIGHQKSLTESVQNELWLLEKETQERWSKLQLEKMQRSIRDSRKEVDRILGSTCVGSHQAIFDKIEQKVTQLEQIAANKQMLNDVDDESHPTSAKSKMEIEIAELITSSVGKIKQIIDTFNIVSFVHVVDPSLERAYERLCKQVENVRKLTDESVAEERLLQKEIEFFDNDARVFESRSEMAHKMRNKHLSDMAHLRMESSSARSAELSLALKAHKRKNFWTAHRIFKLEVILRRLYVIKLLLSALPRSFNEEFMLYKRLVSDVCAYLGETWSKTSDSDLDQSLDLERRLSSLENRSVMVFIRLARGEMPHLSASAKSRIATNARSVAESLKAEAQQQRAEFKSWAKTARSGLKEKKEFVYAIACQRRDQYHQMMKTTEQAIEVLEVTATIICGTDESTEAVSNPGPK